MDTRPSLLIMDIVGKEMKTLKIHSGERDSTILVGERLENLNTYLPSKDVVIITDKTIFKLYGNRFPACHVIEIGIGEDVKNLDTVQYIYGRLLESGAQRSTIIVGIGGGVVCDISGFVASTYLRGLRFGFVPTTLLSQVDASVGGKNGVNLRGYKNLVGVFNQPEFVICDSSLLKTLTEKEILNGCAEVVKHAAIGDRNLFSYLEEQGENVLKCDPHIIERLVYDSAVIKSSIVNRDERENNERRKLNFGHTFGHAVEKVTHMGHGESISIGMVVASAISQKRGLLPDAENKRLNELLTTLTLPTHIRADKIKLMDAMEKDKKREGATINFVLLEKIGQAIIEQISLEELEAVINEEV